MRLKALLFLLLLVLVGFAPPATTAQEEEHPVVLEVLPIEGAFPGQEIKIKGEGFLATLPPGGVGSDLVVYFLLEGGGVNWLDYYGVKSWEDTEIRLDVPIIPPQQVGILVGVQDKTSAPPFSYQVLKLPEMIYLPYVKR